MPWGETHGVSKGPCGTSRQSPTGQSSAASCVIVPSDGCLSPGTSSRPSGRRAMAARRVPTRGREGAWDTWRFGDGSSVHGVDKTTCLIKRV